VIGCFQVIFINCMSHKVDYSLLETFLIVSLMLDIIVA